MDKEITIKNEIVEVCHMLYKNNFIAACDGNVSARISEDRIITTPSGICKGMISVSDLIVTDLDGNKISGTLQPTSENILHSTVYKTRSDVKAVVHAHAPLATAFSIANISLAEAVLPEIVFSLGAIPTAKYAAPTTLEVPESIKDLIKTHDAIILARHGTLTAGKSVMDAYFKTEKIEYLAKVLFYARSLGKVSPLDESQIAKLMEVSEKLGFKKPQL